MNRVLQTTRLLLRPLHLDDLDHVYILWTNDHIRQFLLDNRVISLDDARSFLEASLANFEKHGYGLWLVFTRDGGSLVGFAGFLRSEDAVATLIYGVHPSFCGKGIATEAASAVLSYAFDSLALPRVKADVDEANVVSIRVLDKLGMKRTRSAIVAGRPLVYYEQTREAQS
jgi:RimJ/RimL family protein N-acetyltransferase